MARKRDPKQLLERAQQMEAEARRIREEADQIRKEREAKEDRKAGALLRRFWKDGWTGVELREVTAAAEEVFGAPPDKQTATPSPVHPGKTLRARHLETKQDAHDRPTEVAGGLFGTSVEGKDG